MANNKGSGRGLNAIFIDNYDLNEDNNEKTQTLRLSEIEPDPTQPRTIFDHKPLEELATSIATHGLLQPLLVRATENGYYRIIAGERRWRASKMAGLTEVPVIIVEADDKKAAELSLIENLQREDLTAIEEAVAYKALMETHNYTQEEVSARIGKSRSAISNTIRLLDLPEKVIEYVKEGSLTAGHARALLPLGDDQLICLAADKIISEGLSVRATENSLVPNLIQKAKKAEEATDDPTEVKVDYIADLEKRVASHMGRLFKIHTKGKRKKIEIEYSDDRDLENIIKQLCGNSFFED